MKKKLFMFVAMLALLASLLAICVAAEDYVHDGVHYSLDTRNKVAKVSQGNRTATSEIASIPSTFEYNGETYKVTSISNDAFRDNKTVREIRILSEYITVIPASMIANTYDGALEKIYIDFSNITSIGSAGLNPSDQTNGNGPKANKFFYYDARAYRETSTDVLITNPDFSNMTSIGSAAFQGANFEKLTVPAAVELVGQMFRMSTIKELVVEGENRTTIALYNFQSCKQLEKIVIKSRNLKTISNDVFAGDTAVKEIYIDMSKCESVSGTAFCFSTQYDHGNTTTQWYNLEGEKIVDLSSMKTFYGQCFSSSNIGSAKIIWPRAIESLQDQAFRKCNINGQPMVFNVAEGKTITLPYWAFNENYPSIVLCDERVTEVSAGCSAEAAVFLCDSVKFTNSSFCKNGTIYCKGVTEGSTNMSATIVNITDGTINNYGVCGVVANVTTVDGNVTIGEVAHTTLSAINNAYCPVGKVTETTCKYCDFVSYSVDGETVEKKAHVYVLDGAITYVSFFEMGYKTTKCECGDEQAATEATEAAIFVLRGISYAEFADKNGKFSVTQGYSINRAAYNNYVNSGKSLDYGFVVAGKSVAGTKPLTVNEGKVEATSQYVYTTSKGQLAHDYVDVKVTGFDATNNGAEIIMCLFAFDGETVVYLNNLNGTPVQSLDAEAIVLSVAENN